MTKLLDDAIARARKLPQAEQDQAAQILLSAIDRDLTKYPLTEAQMAVVRRTLEEVRAGKVASSADMRALWKKYDV